MNGPCVRHAFAAVAILASLFSTPAPAQQVMYDVQVFEPVGGQPSVFATAMNEQGVIVGYSGEVQFDSLATPLAILQGRVVEGPKPNESLNFPLGVGRVDLIVGTSSTFPYAWVRGVPRMLQPAGGLPQGSAIDANSQGIICGEVVRDFTGGQFPVVWPNSSAAGIKLKGIGSNQRGSAFAINENNQVAGSIQGLGGYGFVAVRWDCIDAPPRPLGLLPGAMNSESLCINNLGDVAGRSSFPDNSIEAIVYIDESRSLIGLGNLGSPYSYARGINDARQVVGESATPSREIHGFIWHEGVLRDLNDLIRHTSDPILYISNAVAIDSTGRIAAEVRIDTPAGPATRIALLTPVQ